MFLKTEPTLLASFSSIVVTFTLFQALGTSLNCIDRLNILVSDLNICCFISLKNHGGKLSYLGDFLVSSLLKYLSSLVRILFRFPRVRWDPLQRRVRARGNGNERRCEVTVEDFGGRAFTVPRSWSASSARNQYKILLLFGSDAPEEFLGLVAPRVICSLQVRLPL